MNSSVAAQCSSSPALTSAFYIGNVFHKRYQPKAHSFRYPLYMIALDLDEVDELNASHWWFSTRHWAPLQLRVSDYFKASITPKERNSLLSDVLLLKHRVLDVAHKLGTEMGIATRAKFEGIDRVVMLAQLRCFGIYFSPVNFFFLYQGDSCRYLLVEVSNTPWNQRHCYLVDIAKPLASRKNFHVSPFMSMDMEYRWRVRSPTRATFISIENWDRQRIFKAVFWARRHEINRKNLGRVLLQWPVMTLSIVKNIYWQALRLFLKGVRYVPYQIGRIK